MSLSSNLPYHIAADAIEKDSYNKYYTIRTRVYIPSGPYATKRLTITDDKGNVRMDGILKIQPNADNSEVWHLLPIGNYTEVVLATFYYDHIQDLDTERLQDSSSSQTQRQINAFYYVLTLFPPSHPRPQR